jgi:hypothetical protein
MELFRGPTPAPFLFAVVSCQDRGLIPIPRVVKSSSAGASSSQKLRSEKGVFSVRRGLVPGPGLDSNSEGGKKFLCWS